MIQETLQQPYARSRWTALLAEVLPNVSIYQTPQKTEEGAPEFVRDFLQLGHVRLEDGKNLAIFEVKVSGKIDLSRNRVALRDFVARQINLGTTHGVLCVFNSSEPTYRFTFVCKETTLDESGQITTTETNPRRFTYILGPGETRRTAAERFKELAARRDHAGMKEIIEAFSVERLNKEFFDSYKRHYQAFVDNIILSDAPSRLFGIAAIPGSEEFPAACKPVRDWVKRMLGRIVFLHFLQKKGWMGVPADARKWVGGDPKFLQSLFEGCPKKDRFHSTRLAKLFTEALNRPDRSGDIFDITGTRVPYLNGGLFEDGPRALAKLDFPAPLFAGLLDFLGTYNFTIDENDPDENEVGIDPEMLGHIFENLLEDNKDKGAFYTPKNAVQYMCQESLIRFFASLFGDRDEIRRLVRLKDPGDRDDPKNWIRQNARAIEKALDAIKICDPAIGSGAFPIGLLQEIFWIKLTLDWTLDPAETKRKIIQNSIYGVDLDPGAVEIARLRFWLALVVDEKEPRPLPNLDFKIMQGDSLLESFEGIDLSRLHTGQTTGHALTAILGSDQAEFELDAVKTQMELRTAARREAITGLIDSYFSATSPAEKSRLHREVDDHVREHIAHAIAYQRDAIETRLLRIRAEFGKNRKAARGWEPSARDKKKVEALEAEIESLNASATKLAALEGNPQRPFFLWHLFFQEVIAQGGFDIVIANPPYVRADNPEALAERKRVEATGLFQTLWEKWDLYVAFIERGHQILRPDGILCNIVSDAYCHSKYAIKSQKWFLENSRILRIDFLSELQLFDAAVKNVLFFFQKADGKDNTPERRVHTGEFGRASLLPAKKQSDSGHRVFFPQDEKMEAAFSCATVRLDEICYVSVGMVAHADEKICKGEFKLEDLVVERRDAKHPKRFVEGKHLERWMPATHKWIEWGTDRVPSMLRRPTFPELYAVPEKLISVDISAGAAQLRVTYDDSGLIHNHSAWSFVRWNDLKNVRNRSLRKQAAYANQKPKAGDRKRAVLEQLSTQFAPKYLIAVMNSNVARDWLRARRRSNIHMYPDDWKPLPIPDIPPEAQAPIIALVDEILTLKRADPAADIATHEAQIDALVSALYGAVSRD